MRKLRNWLIVLVPIILFGWGVYAFVFNWVVPKSAMLTLPHKWRRIPFRQPAETAHSYFGIPLKSVGNREEWESGANAKKYSLTIYYTADSMVTAYSVHYSYKSWLVSRRYLLDSASLR